MSGRGRAFTVRLTPSIAIEPKAITPEETEAKIYETGVRYVTLEQEPAGGGDLLRKTKRRLAGHCDVPHDPVVVAEDLAGVAIGLEGRVLARIGRRALEDAAADQREDVENVDDDVDRRNAFDRP